MHYIHQLVVWSHLLILHQFVCLSLNGMHVFMGAQPHTIIIKMQFKLIVEVIQSRVKQNSNDQCKQFIYLSQMFIRRLDIKCRLKRDMTNYIF